jgi:hypothetical protein
MKTKILLLAITLFLTEYAFAQSFATDTLAQTEIAKLGFLTGKWQGNGWMMRPDGQKADFDQTEHVQFKLDSTVLLIEGVGQHEGRIVHNAMAIVSYNQEATNYTFQSYLQNGRKGEFTGELLDGKFHWYPNENMRYIIEVNENDQWYETGEIKQGDNWYQFFEMTLDRKE